MLRTLLRLKPRDVPVRVALRNTVAVVAPLAIAVALGHPAIGMAMATGAINTMFTDLPGPYALRMRRMLMAAAAAGLSAALGIALGAHDIALLVAVLVFGMVGGLMVALGPVAARLGLTSVILLMLSADMHLPAHQAPGVAALIFAGGLLQMLFAVAAWPLQRYRPERFALATILQQLAIIARTRPDASQPSPTLQTAQDTMVLLHGEHRAHGVAVESFRIIADLCERVRLELLSLSDLHVRLEAAEARTAIETLLKQAAMALDHLSAAMRDARPPIGAMQDSDALDRALDALAALKALPTGSRDARLLRIAMARAAGLAGQLRALMRNGYWASSQGEIGARRVEASLPMALRPGAPLATLRANLKLSSVAFRHAIRCGVCLVAAVGFERGLSIPHGIWIPMTTAIVLKPDFGGTLSFGALRVAGTFAGLLIATVLVHFAMDGVVLRLLLLAALCFGFRLFTQVNYGLGVALLTGMLVLLLSFEGVTPGAAIEARVVATLLGSMLALLAYAAWPTWEGERSRLALARLVEAYREHLAALFAGNLQGLSETRSATRAARTNAQASLERLRAEPRRRGNRAEAQLMQSLMASTSRLIRAPLAFEAMLREGARVPGIPELDDFTRATEVALQAISASLRGQRKASAIASVRPTERKLAEVLGTMEDSNLLALADACDRIADSVDTLAHQLRNVSAPLAPPVPAPVAG